MTGVDEPDDLVEEVNSQDRPFEVEPGFEEDPAVRGPFDPDQVDVIIRRMTVDLLLSRLRTGQISLLRPVQRRSGQWNAEAKSRLIESLLLRLPLPNLLAAETEDGVWVIVDGIQRLTAIREFVEPDSIDAEPLRLRDLEYMSEFAGASFDDLPGRLQTRLREYEFGVVLARLDTPNLVKYDVFSRLNTEGLRLNSTELHIALAPRAVLQLLESWAAGVAFRSTVSRRTRSDRSTDAEMILRFLAYHLASPAEDDDLDDLLKQCIRRLSAAGRAETEALRATFDATMTSAEEIFGSFTFRRRDPQNPDLLLPLNKALFEAITVNLASFTVERRAVLAERRGAVQAGFMDLMRNGDFVAAISRNIDDPGKVRRRFDDVRNLFMRVLS
ncbi:DUF262 domain-containing protein [Catenuloplanes sp. NPDC051500]|uniref:GmrSD restriction endonuclease domain-containing protein n=1 Tax=Catenuloplanes sp. NPDC051500 TaxID=3363959 RepID=UPI00378C8E29